MMMMMMDAAHGRCSFLPNATLC